MVARSATASGASCATGRAGADAATTRRTSTAVRPAAVAAAVVAAAGGSSEAGPAGSRRLSASNRRLYVKTSTTPTVSRPNAPFPCVNDPPLTAASQNCRPRTFHVLTLNPANRIVGLYLSFVNVTV